MVASTMMPMEEEPLVWFSKGLHQKEWPREGLRRKKYAAIAFVNFSSSNTKIIFVVLKCVALYCRTKTETFCKAPPLHRKNGHFLTLFVVQKRT